MTTWEPSAPVKFGLPASSLMPSLATMTPLPVAIWSGRRWRGCRCSASGSSSGCAGFAGHSLELSFGGVGTVGVDATTWTRSVESGVTWATAGSACTRRTSAADMCAATALTLTSWVIRVPPWARMSATSERWSARVAALRCGPFARSFSVLCWSSRATMTAPPLAAPSTAGARCAVPWAGAASAEAADETTASAAAVETDSARAVTRRGRATKSPVRGREGVARSARSFVYLTNGGFGVS